MTQFNTDLEGPITLNDNAFELTAHFLDQGDRFFALISRYDDVLADVLKREDYKAGDTLRLILPFFKAYGLTNEMIESYSRESLKLIGRAKETVAKIRALMPAFIVSTSYEPYVRAACEALDLPVENAYFTEIDLDRYGLPGSEKERLKTLYREILSMSMIEIPEDASSISDFSPQAQETIKRLDEIFWEEISNMKVGSLLREVNPIGGKEKVGAIHDSLERTGVALSELIYVGDSITDSEALFLVRAKGGLAVSFNGNKYALCSAEVACISESAAPLYQVAKAFHEGGKEKVLKLISKGKFVGEVQPTRLTTEVDEGVIKESERMRRLVRGEKIGKLG